MNHPYTFSFMHISTVRSNDLFIERFSVFSNEMKNDKSVIYINFNLSFTCQDVRTLPNENLLNYFAANDKKLKNRITFTLWENHSELTDEEVKNTIIHFIFKSPDMKEAFWQTEDMFYGLCTLEEAIINKSYEIKVLEQRKIKIHIDAEEYVLMELEGGVKEANVCCFEYHYEFCEPLSVFDFLEKETEKAFFRDVLKKTSIRRLVAPVSED